MSRKNGCLRQHFNHQKKPEIRGFQAITEEMLSMYRRKYRKSKKNKYIVYSKILVTFVYRHPPRGEARANQEAAGQPWQNPSGEVRGRRKPYTPRTRAARQKPGRERCTSLRPGTKERPIQPTHIQPRFFPSAPSPVIRAPGNRATEGACAGMTKRSGV